MNRKTHRSISSSNVTKPEDKWHAVHTETNIQLYLCSTNAKCCTLKGIERKKKHFTKLKQYRVKQTNNSKKYETILELIVQPTTQHNILLPRGRNTTNKTQRKINVIVSNAMIENRGKRTNKQL